MRRFWPLILLFSSPAWAAPSISSIGGTFSGNADSTSANIATITGTGFGSKSPAAPYCWYTGEVGVSTEPSSLGQVTNWSASQHMTSTTTAATGSKAVCSDDSWLDPFPNNLQWNVQLDFNLGYSAKYFLSYDHRVTYTENSSGGGHNWKWQRWWETDGAQPDHYVGTQGPFDQTVQQEGNGTVVFLNGVWIHPADRGKTWTKEEYRWQLNSAQGVGDGGWKIWMWDANQSSANWKSDSLSAGGTPDNVFLEDDPSNFTPAWSFAMLDNVYADSSWARVVVGSSPTYDGSYRREMMIPKTWSTTSITAYFHQGGFANGTTAYVYVCDSNDSCNATGFSIVINGSGGGNAPPTVDAGVDQAINLPSSATLDATVSDDVAIVGSTWTKVSGPGTVTFGNLNSVDTTASFSAAGTYVLQLAASDGTTQVTDTIQIVVSAALPNADVGVIKPNKGYVQPNGGFIRIRP
jgi:hypothetical protein